MDFIGYCFNYTCWNIFSPNNSAIRRHENESAIGLTNLLWGDFYWMGSMFNLGF